MKKCNDTFDTQVSFRADKELRSKVLAQAQAFDQDESWGWRYLAARGLGDDAPEKYKLKLAMLGHK